MCCCGNPRPLTFGTSSYRLIFIFLLVEFFVIVVLRQGLSVVQTGLELAIARAGL